MWSKFANVTPALVKISYSAGNNFLNNFLDQQTQIEYFL